eukprot:15434335-Alexandrium_andersonii.AAC.1
MLQRFGVARASGGPESQPPCNGTKHACLRPPEEVLRPVSPHANAVDSPGVVRWLHQCEGAATPSFLTLGDTATRCRSGAL